MRRTTTHILTKQKKLTCRLSRPRDKRRGSRGPRHEHLPPRGALHRRFTWHSGIRGGGGGEGPDGAMPPPERRAPGVLRAAREREGGRGGDGCGGHGWRETRRIARASGRGGEACGLGAPPVAASRISLRFWSTRAEPSSRARRTNGTGQTSKWPIFQAVPLFQFGLPCSCLSAATTGPPWAPATSFVFKLSLLCISWFLENGGKKQWWEEASRNSTEDFFRLLKI
jgi:hypothetical protein